MLQFVQRNESFVADPGKRGFERGERLVEEPQRRVPVGLLQHLGRGPARVSGGGQNAAWRRGTAASTPSAASEMPWKVMSIHVEVPSPSPIAEELHPIHDSGTMIVSLRPAARRTGGKNEGQAQSGRREGVGRSMTVQAACSPTRDQGATAMA